MKSNIYITIQLCYKCNYKRTKKSFMKMVQSHWFFNNIKLHRIAKDLDQFSFALAFKFTSYESSGSFLDLIKDQLEKKCVRDDLEIDYCAVFMQAGQNEYKWLENEVLMFCFGQNED